VDFIISRNENQVKLKNRKSEKEMLVIYMFGEEETNNELAESEFLKEALSPLSPLSPQAKLIFSSSPIMKWRKR